MTNESFRFYIKVRTALSIPTRVIYDELNSVYGNEAPGLNTVERWSKLFRDRREEIEDKARPGRSITEITTENIKQACPDASLLTIPSIEPKRTRKVAKSLPRYVHYFTMNYEQWRKFYDRKIDDVYSGWGDQLMPHFTQLKIYCTILFRYHHTRKNQSHKKNCNLFSATGCCKHRKCPVTIEIEIEKEPKHKGDPYVFKVTVVGDANHNPKKETAARQLTGARREAMAKRVHQIGALGVFEHNVRFADEDLLREGNFTEIPSLDVLKTAKQQYNKKYRLDEDCFKELRMYGFFTRFTDYASKCFKDKDSSIMPLIGALLTDHTAASITSYFNCFRSKLAVRSKSARPSFVVIDFSAALINSVLASFNVETIHSYLRRCYNTTDRAYDTKQLKNMTCLRLCCAHAMKVFSRSLFKINVSKDNRRNLMSLFSILLNSTSFHGALTLYTQIVFVYGDPNNENASDVLKSLLSKSDLSDFDVRDDKPLKQDFLDEIDITTDPIIHQSPFNVKACASIPALRKIMEKQKPNIKPSNPLYSLKIIQLFHKCDEQAGTSSDSIYYHSSGFSVISSNQQEKAEQNMFYSRAVSSSSSQASLTNPSPMKTSYSSESIFSTLLAISDSSNISNAYDRINEIQNVQQRVTESTFATTHESLCAVNLGSDEPLNYPPDYMMDDRYPAIDPETKLTHLEYSVSAGIKNTGDHFIAIIKSNNNQYYCFNDLDPRGCYTHSGLVTIDFAVYVLKV
ncbi:unnamed protein product [Rotaria sp. Silwood1]|nr:unnamed protein product [Rotaria sp. Silwood1]